MLICKIYYSTSSKRKLISLQGVSEDHIKAIFKADESMFLTPYAAFRDALVKRHVFKLVKLFDCILPTNSVVFLLAPQASGRQTQDERMVMT